MYAAKRRQFKDIRQEVVERPVGVAPGSGLARANLAELRDRVVVATGETGLATAGGVRLMSVTTARAEARYRTSSTLETGETSTSAVVPNLYFSVAALLS
jgi:hypothetical protein